MKKVFIITSEILKNFWPILMVIAIIVGFKISTPIQHNVTTNNEYKEIPLSERDFTCKLNIKVKDIEGEVSVYEYIVHEASCSNGQHVWNGAVDDLMIELYGYDFNPNGSPNVQEKRKLRDPKSYE
jgi:hypothetical protein